MSTQGRLAPALGWFGIALGAAEMVAPKGVARAIGTRDHALVVRAFGAREVAAGVSILSRKNPAQGMWMRVAGDALDLAALALCTRRPENDRKRLAAAIAAVSAVALADVYAAIVATRAGNGVPKRPALVKSVSMMTSREALYERVSDASWLPEHVPGLSGAAVAVVNEIAPSSLQYEIAGLPGGLGLTLRATLTDQGAGRGTALRIEAVPGTKDTANARFVRALAELPGDALAFGLHRLKNVVEIGEVVSAAGPSGRRIRKQGAKG